MTSGIPVLKDLVLVGGGHSHVSVIKSFGMDPVPGVRLTVISRDVHAPYSGMLPGLIAGHYTFDEAHIDLRPLAAFAGARFLHDEVVGVDTDRKEVSCRGRPPIPYDVMSINVGSTPGLTVPGAAGSVVPVKPIDSFWQRWEILRDRCLARRDETHVAVVGGGAGGVELLLSVQYQLGRLLADQGRSASYIRFHLVTATDEILSSHNFRARAKFARVLAERRIEVHVGQRVERVLAAGEDDSAGLQRAHRLELAGGGQLDVDEVLWVTTARAAPWPGDSGLQVDERGFIEVHDTLQTFSDPDVFAVGDVAAVVNHPRPKAGVFAVRQGPPLTANLRAHLVGEETRAFRPQEEFLSLVSTGDRYAVASRGEWATEGGWVWRWKDRIDRRFMRDFSELPEMEAGDAADEAHFDPRLIDDEAAAELALHSSAAAPDAPTGLSPHEKALEAIASPAMRCGGCGAKVGADVLARVLSQLWVVNRDDVVVGVHDADDAAVIEVPAGKQLVQTNDFFRAFLDDPYVFGAIAANHALGDIFAMGAEPQTALATVMIPHGLEAKVEADLIQLLAGAVDTLNAVNTALVGGHTAEGAELAIGFSVSGLVDAGAARGIGGLRAGDGLILTKSLGTGVLFAADMRARAKGRWIEAALRSMRQSSRDAALCLVEHGASAMTDITGFGLLGHAVEMSASSGVALTLVLDSLPALDGAVQTIQAGLYSSLQAANLRLRRAIVNVSEAASHKAYPLLFDPQTAGGLLAGVPGDNVDSCVNALRDLGYGSATAIGTVYGDADGGTVRLLP